MYKFTIYKSDKGYEVYINLISSSAGHYLSRRPYVMNLIKEALPTLSIKGDKVIIERNMGRGIGNSDVVTTSDNDNIYYAQPIKKVVYSRFAKNRIPNPSQTLTIVLQKDDDGNYEVSDTWIGNSRPPFPGDENETDDSKTFWETHALIHDAQIIQTKSITKNCPY